MKNTRTNMLLIEIIKFEESLSPSERNPITIFSNGFEFKGKIITDNEYYDLILNRKYKEIYEEHVKKPRTKHIEEYNSSGDLSNFPDQLRQGYLHLLDFSGKSYQIRVADIIAFSFD